MSTQYRDPPQWKTNAAQRLDVEMFARLNAASDRCGQFLRAANAQLKAANDFVEAGGDFLEAQIGTEAYDKMRAAAEAKGSGSSSGSSLSTSLGAGEKVPDPLLSAPSAEVGQAPFPAQTEPASPQTPESTPKRKYMPRLKSAPVYVLAVRAAELQRELVPILQEFGHALLAAGVDIRRHLHPDVVAQVIRDEFGVELEEIDDATYDLMHDTIVKTNQWLHEFKEKAAREMEAESAPPGKDAATDG